MSQPEQTIRMVPGWHFFNDHVEICDVVRRDGLLDAWYDELAQFDLPALESTVASHGFTVTAAESVSVWGQQILLLTATRL